MNRFFTTLSIVLVLAGCQQDKAEQANANVDETAISQTIDSSSSFKVSGVASKGPIQNATVEIYALDNTGVQVGSPLASTTTDTNGQWQVSFNNAPTAAVLINVSGGSYIDEADPAVNKRTITLAANETLSGILFPGFTTASVTILTNALLEKSRVETTANNFQAVLTNNQNTAKLALGFDPFTVAAADPLSPSTSASTDSIEYAMYLGGVANALNSAAISLGNPVPDYAIMMGMVDDLSDGKLDGKKLSANVTVVVNSASLNFPTNIDLNLAIKRFRNNNFLAYSVTNVTGVVTVNESILSVPGTNVSPTATDDSASTISGVAITLNNVLANDTDADADQLTIASFTQPSNGSVTEVVDGIFTFTPTAGFVGNTVFSYIVSDSRGGSDTAQVVISVAAAPVVTPPTTNVLPIANAGSNQTLVEQTAASLIGSGTDTDGTITSYQWSQISGPTVTLTLASDNPLTATFTTPTITSVEVLVFSLTVTDDQGGIGINTVNIVVTPVNSAPTVSAGTDQTISQGNTTINLLGVASDSDGSINVSSILWQQIGGTTSVSLLTPTALNSSFLLGPITATEALLFSLTVTDNEGVMSVDTVTVLLNAGTGGSTTAPVANAGGNQTLNEQLGVTLDAIASTDSDGTITSYSWTQTGGIPAVTLVNSNTVQASFVGPNIATDTTFTFFVIVTDNDGQSSTDSVDISMVADIIVVNGNPVANVDNFNTEQGIPLTGLNVTSNDTDADLDPIILIGVTQPANGKAVNNGDGTVSYTPNLSFNGVDTFNYSVIDGQGGTATGAVNITVNADTDGDGILDSVEIAMGLDANNADTDGDGFYDGHEILITGTAAFLSNEMPPTTVISTANSNNVISVDTTWTLANAPYWLQSDVTIASGVTLAIEPGVVIKSALNVDIYVSGGGNIIAKGNAAIPQHIVFTSDKDDTINGDTNGDANASFAGENNWNGIDMNAGSSGTIQYAAVKNAYQCIVIYNSSPVIDNVEVGDCYSYGIYVETSSSTRTANLSNITINDYDANGYSTRFAAGIKISSTNSATAILNLKNISITEAGSSGSYQGLYLDANGGTINGSIDTVNITNAGGDGIYITDGGSNPINVALNDLTITGSGNNSLDIRQNSTGLVSTTFDGTNNFSNNVSTAVEINITGNSPNFLVSSNNLVDGGSHSLSLLNSNGIFNNFAFSNPTIAGLLLNGSSAPTTFNNIVLTNAPSPYELVGSSISPTIIAGYDFTDVSVIKTHARVRGTLGGNLTLSADPLGSGNSVYLVSSSITIPSGIALTINDGAILKFAASTRLTVNGSLVIGDGDGLGTKAILTSFRDNSVGVSVSDGVAVAAGNWQYINVGTNSSINIDNAEIRYAQRGLYQANTAPVLFDISNTLISNTQYYGIDSYHNTGDTVVLNLDTVSFDTIGSSTNYHGLYVQVNNNATLGGTWNNVTMNNIAGTGILLDDNSTGAVAITISGLTIGNTGTVGQYGVDLQGDATTSVTFNNTAGTNTISGGSYNLLLRGVVGSYANLNLSGSSISSIYLSLDPNPSFWDDASIVLTGPSPYTLASSFPSSIGVLGTANIGYDVVNSAFTDNIVTLRGTINNAVLVADPLNTTDSIYSVET